MKIVDIKKVDCENENELLMRVKEHPIAGAVIITDEFKKLKGVGIINF